MNPEERQRHIEELISMRDGTPTPDGWHVVIDHKALTAAIAALEREGQMEAVIAAMRKESPNG